MTDVLEKLAACERAENEGRAYPFFPEIWGEARGEIERLREALRHYVSECDCNGGTYHEDDHITGKTLVKDCPKCEPARAALGEKE